MTKNSKKKLLPLLLWILFGLVAVAIVGLVISKSAKKEHTYELLNPTAGDSIIHSTVLTGSIEPRDEVLVKPQMSGIIAELLHLPGDMVQEGDLVARIRMVPDIATVQNAASRVESARVAVRTAYDVYRRDSLLMAQKILAREKYEQSKGSYDRAIIDLESAQEQLQLVSKGSSARTAQQNNTLVRATVSGTILEQPVKVGTSVIQANNFNDGTTIVSIADLNDLLFVGNVNESDVNKVSIGAHARLRVGAITDRTYPATVEYVSPKGKDTAGTILFEVKAALHGGDLSDLKAGFSSNAEIELDRRTDVLTIPESAITYEGDQAYVFVSANGGNKESDFTKQAVTLGLSDGLKVEVVSGLQGNEQLRGNQLSSTKK